MISNNDKKTVLVVEDSPTQALSLRLLLEDQGLEVLHASNGTGGLDLAKEHLPEVIILDIEMPGMSGFEVAVQLSNESSTAHIPIIMLTSHDNANALRKGIALGAIDFIPKDIFADAVLVETLHQLGLVALVRTRIVGEDRVEI